MYEAGIKRILSRFSLHAEVHHSMTALHVPDAQQAQFRAGCRE